jgi:hypothetical protein
MSAPNYQDISDKFGQVIVTLQTSLKNMEKLKVNPVFLAKIQQHYDDLLKISHQVNRLIKENPQIETLVDSTIAPKKF